MKKLILSAAILLGSLSTFAQDAPAQTPEAEKSPATEATATDAATTTDAAATTEAQPAATAAATDGYTEVKTEELPAAVGEALKKSFPDAKLNKVSINEKKEYKLEVEVGDKVGSLYADASGKWIQ